MTCPDITQQKFEHLRAIVAEMTSALVAFSGGIDSTLVLKIAHDQLGERALAVTAVSPTFPHVELELSRRLCREIGVRHIIHQTDQLQYDAFVKNDATRCYHCKTDLYSALVPMAQHLGIHPVLDGTHRDDIGDDRPGLQAARDYGIRSPLLEAEMGKEDIRQTAQTLGLSNWDKPATACLSSRIMRGELITVEKLQRVEQAEAYLLELGFRQVRVRDRSGQAHIEVGLDELNRLSDPTRRQLITRKLIQLGFTTVTCDPQGYRQGNTNRQALVP